MPKSTTQCPRPGLEPRLLDPETWHESPVPTSDIMIIIIIISTRITLSYHLCLSGNVQKHNQRRPYNLEATAPPILPKSSYPGHVRRKINDNFTRLLKSMSAKPKRNRRQDIKIEHALSISISVLGMRPNIDKF